MITHTSTGCILSSGDMTLNTVGSISGNLTATAGKEYRQVGSDVMAPGRGGPSGSGNVSIQAQTVTIQEARETSSSQTETKFRQSGISVGISNPLISAGQTAQSLGQAAGNTSDSRMQALAAAAAGLNGYNTYNSLTDAAGKFSPAKAADISLNISIGSSRSQSNSASQSDTARGSTVTAGNNINIQATGAGKDSNLTVQGSQVQAGNNVTLAADNQINLLAAQNTASQTSSNSSSSSSVGMSYSPASGWGVNASASRGQGSGNGSDVSYTNTQVQAGNTASLNSGGDTTLKGAVVAANTVQANVGGNLAVESLQDTSTYTSRQSSAGGSISVGGGKLGGGVSVGRSHIDSNYQSVTQQSGIQAGDGGFQVGVTGNTDLQGGVIASTQTAIDQNRNSFATGGTLTTSDIQNSASYEGKAIGISASVGPKNTDTKGNTSYLPGVGFGIGGDKGSASSTTTAGISGIAGNTAVRTGDAQTGIAPIFDAGKVQREIDAQVQITQAFGKDASKAVGDYAQTQINSANSLRAQANAIAQSDPQGADALNAQAQQIEKNWGANGILRLAAHTVIGGLTGGASGALGAAAGTLTAPAVDQALREAGITGPLASTLTALASTAVGAATGGTAGAGAALNEVANNYLNHAQEQQLKTALANCKGDITCIKTQTQNWQNIESAQSADAQTCQSGRVCADISKDARTGNGFSPAEIASLCAGEPSCTAFATQLSRNNSNDTFTANERATSIPVARGVQTLIDRGLDPNTAQIVGSVTPADLLGAAISVGGMVSSSRGVSQGTVKGVAQATGDIPVPTPTDGTATSPYSSNGRTYQQPTYRNAAGEVLDAEVTSGVRPVPSSPSGGVTAASPAANNATKVPLVTDLATAQSIDPLIGTTLPGAKAPVTVTAESNIGGRTLVDTNQTARPVTQANPNQPTLISDLVRPGAPNSNMANAHAEVGLIQQAYNAGLTQGQSMTIVVRGQAVCSFCGRDVPVMADRAGLNSLTIVDGASGKTYQWNAGSRGWSSVTPGLTPKP